MISPLHRLPLASSDTSLLETVLSAAVHGVMTLNADGAIGMFNPACEQMFQYGRAEVSGRGLFELLAPPYREEYETHLSNFRQTGLAATAGTGRKLEARRKDGSVFPIFLSWGETTHDGRRMFVAIVQDLEQAHYERAVAAEERAFLAAIVDSANDAIISKTLDGKITSWNRAAETLFGYCAAEMIGSSILRLFPEDRLDEEARILGAVRQGHAVERYETVRQRKDGSTVDVSVTVSPVRDITGRVIGASKTVRDISERKATEARFKALSNELYHVARLSEMSQVSAALAHELNQPLAAILNYTNLAKRLMKADGDSQKALDAVTKAGDQALRAGHIIRRLRDFVEKRDSARRLENISAVTEDAIELGLVGSKAAAIRTQIRLSENLPPVLIDKVQIQQVLINLLRNAADAMVQSETRIITVTAHATGTGTVVVRIADTGPGVPQMLAERLFRPFVTTKPGGMGIGLAISRSIIESHGGRLTMEPNPGGGSIFQFTLPAVTRIME